MQRARLVAAIEWLTAAIILCIAGLVLYVVFAYRP
jgi:hypothetical protein